MASGSLPSKLHAGGPTISYPPPSYVPPVGVSPATSPTTNKTQNNPGMSLEQKEDAVVDVREITRTPSPTPTEAQVLAEKTKLIDWKKVLHPRTYTSSRRGMWTLLIIVLVLGFIIAFLVEQKKIERALRPFAQWMHDTTGGWLIPIGIMFVLSFPPLFGHEIIAVICGDVWGVWIGFGIVAAGTVLGELGNFYAFKWCCNARGKRLEEKRVKYALYAQIVREGGLKMPVVMRFSIIPGHLLTAVFSVCGMSVWRFLAAAILSTPKQLALVYVGVSQDDSGVGSGNKGNVVKAIVVLMNIAITILSMWYINKKMDEAKHRVVYARRKARQAKALAAATNADLPALAIDGSETPASTHTTIKAPSPRAFSMDAETIQFSTLSASTRRRSHAHDRTTPAEMESGVGEG